MTKAAPPKEVWIHWWAEEGIIVHATHAPQEPIDGYYTGPYLSPRQVLEEKSEAWRKGQRSVLDHQKDTRRVAPRRQNAAFIGPPIPANPYAAKLAADEYTGGDPFLQQKENPPEED